MSNSQSLFKVGDKRRYSENKSLKRLKVSMNELREDPETVLKHRNCLNFLSNRQLGETAGIQAENEFYQMKTSHKEKASSFNLSMPFTYDSCEVNFLRGDDISLFGVWRLNDGKKNNYVMGEINYNVMRLVSYSYTEVSAPETCKLGGNIIDMCRGMTICNYPPEHPPSFIDVCNMRRIRVDEFLYPPWNCCCFLHKLGAVAVGGDGYIFITHPTYDVNFCYLKLPGKVCTLSTGPNLLLAGLNTGDIWSIDFRANSEEYFYVQISDKAINDSVVINNQEVIVTDVEGKLVKVDLRTRKISATYFGHKHSVTKRPFSVENDMLCATGADNVVRIWHVSGGHPIHVHKSTSGHEVRGWLHSDSNKTYLNYFERDTRTVFTI